MPVTARALLSTEVHTVTLPYVRSSVTHTTVIKLEKATPTSQPNTHSQLSPSSIGAIIGSILALIVLLLLIYCCCLPGDVGDEYSTSNNQAGNNDYRKSSVVITPAGSFYVRKKPRRQHEAPLNENRQGSQGPSRRETIELIDEIE